MDKVKLWESTYWSNRNESISEKEARFYKELDQYAQDYFSSHFVEAVIKCIPGGPYWDVSDKILSAFNKLILENAERLVNEKQ